MIGEMMLWGLIIVACCLTTVSGQYSCNAFANSTKSEEFVAVGGTVPSGTPCCFPFVYRGQVYYECTTRDNSQKPWCAVESVYQEGYKLWGFCYQRVTPAPTTKYSFDVMSSTERATNAPTKTPRTLSTVTERVTEAKTNRPTTIMDIAKTTATTSGESTGIQVHIIILGLLLGIFVLATGSLAVCVICLYRRRTSTKETATPETHHYYEIELQQPKTAARPVSLEGTTGPAYAFYEVPQVPGPRPAYLQPPNTLRS